jgi:hypothetical protein
MGFNRFSESEVCFLQIPLPTGEGAAKRRVRGTVMKIPGKTSKKCLWYPSPGPLARATLSRWERDLPEAFRILDTSGL